MRRIFRLAAALPLCLVPALAQAQAIVAPSSGPAAVSTATVGTSASQILAAATSRRLNLSVCNVSASATVAVSLGTTAPALNTAGSWTLNSGQCIAWDGLFVPSDSLHAIASAANTPLTVEADQ